MKKVALFSTWCDNQEKLEVLNKNIDKVREKGLDVVLISPIKISLPKNIVDKSDYIIYTKENPINKNKIVVGWVYTPQKKLVSANYDYGFASLVQFKRLIEFSTNFEYDEYYVMIYDININDDDFEKVLSTKHTASFFLSKKGTALAGTLMIFNKENAIKFSSLITWESYFRVDTDVAEDWLKRVRDIIGGYQHQIYVEDIIDQTIKVYYKYDKFSLFIQKSDQKPSFLYFFNVSEEQPAIVNVNNIENNIIITENSHFYIDTDIQILEIKLNNINIDLTNEYNRISSNFTEEIKK